MEHLPPQAHLTNKYKTDFQCFYTQAIFIYQVIAGMRSSFACTKNRNKFVKLVQESSSAAPRLFYWNVFIIPLQHLHFLPRRKPINLGEPNCVRWVCWWCSVCFNVRCCHTPHLALVGLNVPNHASPTPCRNVSLCANIASLCGPTSSSLISHGARSWELEFIIYENLSSGSV